jgi:1-acyl-sn-glycerol-3-phosphate acyltransferase
MSFPVIGDQLPHRGSRASMLLAQAMMRAAGWRIEGTFPNERKLVVIVAPHTSNWDFIVGVAAIFALHIKVKYLAKDTLFRWPLGVLMRALGGMPVDRSQPHGVVGEVIADFGRYERLTLAITPEGTRKRGVRWKEGFYHIAHGVGAAVVPVTFDYRARAIFIGPPLYPTGNVQAEIDQLKEFCDGDQHAARISARSAVKVPA